MSGRQPQAVSLSMGNGAGRLGRGWLAVLACAIAIALTFATLIGVSAGVANAATPGVTTSVTLNGNKYNNTDVVQEGDTITMKLQYSSEVKWGSTVRLELGPFLQVGALPAGNTAIESITIDPGNPNLVLIKFVNEAPAGVNQGVIDLNFKVKSVEKSSEEILNWTVDGEEQGIEVIIKNQGDDFANVSNGESKSVAGSNPALNSFVSVKDGKVTLADGILGAKIPYTLQLNRGAAAAAYTVSDQLPAGMTYVVDSFTGTQTTWDEVGLNRTTGPIPFAPSVTDNSFTTVLNLAGPSQTTLKYSAVVADEPARVALEAQLQKAYDAVSDEGGNFNVALKNTANLGGTAKDATVTVGGNKPAPGMPGIGKAFAKATSWTDGTSISPAEDGSLDPAQNVTFTLSTDLTQWTGESKYHTLTSNVVISDALPKQLSWKNSDANFLSSEQVTLKMAAPLPANAAAFAADTYINSYYIDAASQTLYINVGKDTTRKIDIIALAQLNTVKDLQVSDSSTVPGQKDYKVNNRAEWKYTDWKAQNVGYTSGSTVHSQTSNEDGFNYPDFFKKGTSSSTVVVKPGTSAEVKYDFTVGRNKGIDLTKSSIVDYVDADIFDVSDLSKFKVSAQYDGGKAMDATSFVLELNDAGNLVITLSDAGKAQIAQWGSDKQFVLSLTLPTRVFEGKETLQIKNKATLFGEDGKALFWSEASSDATSYGDEAEVRKTIRDTPNEEWSKNLRAEMDAEGNLVQEKFVFNVALVPHGSYGDVVIFDVVDNLPDSLKFEGFVNDADVDTGANPTTDVKDLKGNVQAKFEAGANAPLGGTVTMFQKPGTKLKASDGIPSVNILVSIADFTADEAIVNSIGTETSATITPTDGYPLSIRKVDARDGDKVISDANARFQILDAKGEVAVDNVFVQDGI